MPTESGDKQTIRKSSLIRLCDSLIEAVAQVLTCDRNEKRSRFIMLFLTALFLTLFIIPSPQFLSVHYREGDIATSDIRASQDYLIEDLLLTEKKRAEAEAAAPFVYTLAPSGNIELVRRFDEALDVVDDASLHGESGKIDAALREREKIETALRESRGRVAGPFGAANKLGLPRQTLDSKIAALGIDKHQFRHH